jgi:hypothetical protein
MGRLTFQRRSLMSWPRLRCDVWRVRRSWSACQCCCTGITFVVYALEISRESSTDTALLGGGVDTDKDKIRLLYALVDVCREEQVTTTSLADNVLEARFIDGKFEVRAVPRIDTGLIEVNDGNGDVGAFKSNNSACGAACVQNLSWRELAMSKRLTNISGTDWSL